MDDSLLSQLYQYGVWISAPLMAVGLALLVFFIRRAVKVVRRARVLDVPLVEEQDIVFPEAGRVVLCEEGPRLSFRFRRLTYELFEEDGRPVPGRRTWFHAKTSGLAKVRIEMRCFTLPYPGRYTLRVGRLGPPREHDCDHRLVFVRPHLRKVVVCVLGILLGAGLFIGDLVFFILRLTLGGNPA